MPKNEVVVSQLTHPLVEAGACFIVVPNHDLNRPSEVVTGNCWRGPYASKEAAQKEAARWMLQHGWLSCGVFKLMGTVAKPIPDLSWYEVVDAPAESK